MTQPTGSPLPGWQPDPGNPSQLRWWDGTRWTAQTAPMPGTTVEKRDLWSRTVTAAKKHPIRAFIVVAVVVVMIAAMFGGGNSESPATTLVTTPTPSVTVTAPPSGTDATSAVPQSRVPTASSSAVETHNEVTWQDGYIQYIQSLSGSPTFMLLDMGYMYPVLLVRQYSTGSGYSIVAFGGTKAYQIDQVGDFPAYIKYGDGFVFHWSMSVGLKYQGYVIANLVDCYQSSVTNPSYNPQCYSYNLSTDEAGTINYLDTRMSDADAEAQRAKLEAKAKALTTPFNYASDVDQINNTDLDYIRNWS